MKTMSKFKRLANALMGAVSFKGALETIRVKVSQFRRIAMWSSGLSIPEDFRDWYAVAQRRRASAGGRSSLRDRMRIPCSER